MVQLSTTKMSSKGQIVIPEEIRHRLGFKTGTQFVVLGNRDSVILKEIMPPSVAEFDKAIAEARKHAKAAGLKRSDVAKAIKRVRKRK